MKIDFNHHVVPGVVGPTEGNIWTMECIYCSIKRLRMGFPPEIEGQSVRAQTNLEEGNWVRDAMEIWGDVHPAAELVALLPGVGIFLVG